jgi:UDP-glucose 4-epimerase
MRYLVTGGAGFIGSHLTDALLAKQHEVVVLDDFSTGHRKNLAHVLTDITLMEGDLRSSEDVERAVQGCAGVFHQAAVPSVPRSMKDPITSHNVNVSGTVNLLWAAHRAGVKRVVYASSSSVYGDTPRLPKEESMQLFPKSPYAGSKLAGEVYAASFSRAYGLESVGLRYFNVFGPRQDPASPYAAVIPIWLLRMSQGKPPQIFGDGNQSRDFTFIDNVVDANLRAMETPDISGTVFNVAAGERVVLLDMAKALIEAYGYDGTPEHTDPRPGDIEHSWADTSAARTQLGYATSVSWRDGLQRTVRWFRDAGEA